MTPVRGEGLDPAARVEVVNTEARNPAGGRKLGPTGHDQQSPLHHARRKGALGGRPATARPDRGQPRGAHPDQKERAVVGAGAGRTPRDLRRRLAPYVYRSALSPPIARRLHHSRDLGEPFDFITWFDYAPEYEHDFDALLAELHASEEWTYVAREVDIRLVPRARVRDLTSGWGRAFNI
jgi:hypothetical protein